MFDVVIHLVISSKVGFVNIYGPDAASGGADRPKALKMLGNLTTSISTVRFNHDAQLLAVASSVKKDQMRMVCVLKASDAHGAHSRYLDSPTLSDRLLQLADVEHAFGPCYQCGLLVGQRVRGHRKQPWTGIAIPSARLQLIIICIFMSLWEV